MKLLALALLLTSCTPVVFSRASDHAMVVRSQKGDFSCLGSDEPSCCYPYKHHRDIEGAAAMLCSTEVVDLEDEPPISMVEVHLRVVYDETKPFEVE